MNADYDPVETGTGRRRSLIAWLLLPGIAFLLGLAAMGWLLSRWDAAARYVGVAPEAQPIIVTRVVPTAPAPQRQMQTTPGEAEPQRFVIDPETTRRVAMLEQRLAAIGTEARVAVGNADRAEGLLVAFAARRALDRGVALGYLEGLLRHRFGESQPQAVGTIITAARQPVTIEELQEGLQESSGQLTGAGPDQTWWNAFKAELGSLIMVRRQGAPSTMPGERLRRATRRLEAGQVDVALAEVLRMPGRDNAREWIAAASRYVAARRALDTIETAALLDPRNPPQVASPQPAAAPAPVAPVR